MLRLSTALLLSLALAACGSDEEPPADAGDAGAAADSPVFVQQDTATHDAPTGDSGGAQGDSAATTTDSGEVQAGQLVGLELTVNNASLAVADRVTLTLTAVRSSGAKGPLTDAEKATFTVDGLAQSGAGVAPEGTAQPAAAVWTFGGKLQLAGVRPGKASVVATVGTLSSEPLAVTVGWPAGDGVLATSADALGKTDAERKADLETTVQLYGKSIGAGGLTATLRFPESAQAGDRFDLAKPPKSGALSLTLAFADLGGATVKPAVGALWIDQVDKGLYRGSFLGRTTQLKPVVGVFTVPRKGLFGVDLLGDAVQVAQSDDLLAVTGTHYSRVSVVATGDGNAVLYARRIKDGLKAFLDRWQIDGKTGKTTPLTPLVSDANAYDGVPTVKAPAFGQVVRASHGSVTCEVWEGRDGKGATKPHRLWVQLLDDKGTVIGKPTAVSDDVCDGSCQPTVQLLPSTRFLVVWATAGAGVQVRRVKGQPVDGAPAFTAAKPIVIAANGKDPVAAVHGTNVLLGWFDPDVGHVWRHYTDKISAGLSALAPKQPIGVASTQAPRQALSAVTSPSSAPNLLFVSAWIDYTPGAKLAMRRVGLDGTALGTPVPLGDVDADAIWAASGKDGQVTALTRSPKNGLTVRKLRYASYNDTGKLLGEPVPLLAPGGTWQVHPAMAYLPDVDVWVVAWSGDAQSPGVWLRRFR